MHVMHKKDHKGISLLKNKFKDFVLMMMLFFVVPLFLNPVYYHTGLFLEF